MSGHFRSEICKQEMTPMMTTKSTLPRCSATGFGLRCIATAVLLSTCLPFTTPLRGGTPFDSVSASAKSRSNLPVRSSNLSSGTGVYFDGFTEPVRKIEVSASESGRLSTVDVKRGDVIEAGTMMMVLDTNILDASRRVAEAKSKATARIDALVIEANIRQDRYQKLRQLYDDGAGSIEEVRRAEADATVASLEVDQAREEMQLRNLELQEIEARIELRRVRSPIAGVVTDVIKDAGEYVSLQEPHVATVVQLDRLRVTFFVPTRIALQMSTDARLTLVFPESEQVCQGSVEHVGAVTEADSGRVRLDVLLDNRNQQFRSGVRCRMVPSDNLDTPGG